MKKYWVIYVLLNIIDVVLTQIALRNGGAEYNPLIGAAADDLSFILTKIIGSIIVGYVGLKYEKILLMLVGGMIMVCIVNAWTVLQ